MKISRNKAIEILAYIIIIETFVSKMSFFSYSIPTFVNVAFISILSVLLLRVTPKSNLLRNDKYTFIVFSMLILLFFQTVTREPFALQMAGLGTSVMLIFAFGVIFPKALPIDRFMIILRRSLMFSGISSLLLLLSGIGNIYEGGRFSGIFTDSIIMTQVASIGIIVFAIHSLERKSLSSVLMSMVYFLLVIMAGSRTSLMVSIGGILIYFILAYKPQVKNLIIGKPVIIFIIVMLFPFISQIAAGMLTGEIGIGTRKEITNPIDDRLLHWRYGIKRIQESPFLGYGVLTKYEYNGVYSLDSFNEMNDPHNMFIYAGQVGGWPLIVLFMAFYFLLIKKVLYGLLSTHSSVKAIAIVVLLFLAMFFAGGSLFSLGSLMDRFFWLFVGYLAVGSTVHSEGVKHAAR